MSHKTRRVATIALVLGGVLGCGEQGADPGPVTPVTTPPPTMTNPDPSQMPGATAGTAAPAAGAPAMAGTAGAAPMEPPAGVDPPAGGSDAPAEPAGRCMDRRVSYAAPCHDDPDPCNLQSGWPGDEYCLLPPAPGEGIQIHIGPDDYDDPAEIMKYVLAAGGEFNNSVIGHIDLTGERFYDRITVHMRPGSHHWISSIVQGKPAEQFYDGTDCGGAMRIGGIGGGQNLIYDNPPGGVPAPENEGLGSAIQGDSSLCMNLHAYNFSEAEQLREMWINLTFVDEADVTQRTQGIGVVGGLGMAVAPGTNQTLTYEETFQMPGRIIQLFGHRHAWTPRFAVWLNDALIYDSWDWQESVTFNYDTLTENPPINTAGMTDGAISGPVEVQTGDVLKFSCFIENDSDQTLRFSNELYGGEMCNMWGKAVGTGLSATRL
jgi:hypothetical protein